ncbi:flagellar basal body-associated FliL family protein [Venenivibrio stagnispumantis]|uniref:Flagellar protein FliL n=1 Tax=Venenivibrio stagnispumantis TaxID=407998 RepID=A0AA46ACT6_9AQUI|nr:flagellar basal body-associated FliL family protein [Venenivibrio stagnispumantis]MCW4572623.1 flagellar basal body-associated FliL family protein [Venenivibrio stagnispumantis]SMP00646.1 flagellar FliL protein [Venenivibrio stagnispumantis]
MAEEKEIQEGQEEKKGSKLKLLLIIVIALLIAAIVGFFVYTKFFHKEEEKSPSEKITKEIKSVEEKGVEVEAGTYIVNLADKDADRYIKVTIVLEVQDDKVKEEATQRMPQIKDTINTLLFTKTSTELKSPEGVEKLKEDIIRRVNAILPIGGVKNVYFTEFVIQTS